MSGRLDSFQTALREYETVSADSAASIPASDQVGHVRTLPVDVRRFPWIRPLVGDYAFDFPRVEGLYAGNPTDGQAWRDAVARTQRHPRNRAAIAGDPGRPAERARRARRSPRRGGTPGRRLNRRDRHGATGRSVRRTAVHALEGAHGAAPRSGHRRTSTRPSGRDLLGRRRGSRLGGSAALYGARCRVPAPHRHTGRRGGCGRAADCGAHAGCPGRANDPGARRGPSPDRIHHHRHRRPEGRLAAGCRHGSRVRDVD